jgi:hypothetical protein
MIHECNLNCHTMDPVKLNDLGIEDSGKWMPFIFHMDIVEAAKLTTEDKDLATYGCTTIFTNAGDAYIIDTPYMEFFELFKEYNFEELRDSDNDLEL